MLIQWESYANELLKGRTIVKVVYLTDAELKELGWYRRSVAMELDNGNWLVVSADNEGNDGGALQVLTNESIKLIPTL